MPAKTGVPTPGRLISAAPRATTKVRGNIVELAIRLVNVAVGQAQLDDNRAVAAFAGVAVTQIKPGPIGREYHICRILADQGRQDATAWGYDIAFGDCRAGRSARTTPTAAGPRAQVVLLRHRKSTWPLRPERDKKRRVDKPPVSRRFHTSLAEFASLLAIRQGR
jgi:hypothetical protein